MNKKEFIESKPELKGMKIFNCVHLDGGGGTVEYNGWLGEKRRVLLCPICVNIHFMDGLRYTTMHIHNITDMLDIYTKDREAKTEKKRSIFNRMSDEAKRILHL